VADLQVLLNERKFRSWAPSSDDPEVLLEAFTRFCHDVVKIKHPSKGSIPSTSSTPRRKRCWRCCSTATW